MRTKAIKYIGLRPERTRYDVREEVFARIWRKYNKRDPGVNFNCTYLELILSTDEHTARTSLTQRDATVATTIIQWLGTNIGQCFLKECEQAIEKARKK